MPEPILPDSYWIEERLAAGEYPGSQTRGEAEAKAKLFRAAGITLFVDLTDPSDRLEPYINHVAWGRCMAHPIIDNDVPTVDEMRGALDTIDAALAAGETVYVHCWGGIGRTGTVIGCWLVRHGRSPEDAIELIRERRRTTPDFAHDPLSPQTSAQHTFVHGWERGQ